MPPTFKSYDLLHNKYGKIQIKTRALLDRVGAILSNETRAVVASNRNFDWLFHIVLDRDMMVRDAILVPIKVVSVVADSNSGKLSIEQSRGARGAIDLTNLARDAQIKLNFSAGAATTQAD